MPGCPVIIIIVRPTCSCFCDNGDVAFFANEEDVDKKRINRE